MYCTNCGKEIDDNAATCPYCGVSTGVAAEAVAADEPKKKVNIVAIVGFSIALLEILFSILSFAGVLGSASIFICIAVPAIGFVVNVVGIALWKKFRLNGFAIAGLVICILTFLLWLAVLFIVMIFASIIGGIFNGLTPQ